MFKSVRIQNFRQFKDLKLDNLAQINLITGKNNTGKTSLLEALLLHVSPSNPEMVLTIADQRGMEALLADGPGAWGWIFRDSADPQAITIESVDSGNNRMTLRIMTSRGLQIPQTSFGGTNGEPAASEPVISASGRPLHSLILEYEDLQGHRGSSRIRLDGGSRVIEHDAGLFGFKRWYLATKPEPTAESAQIYSRIVLANREEDVVEALRVIDARLRRLRLLDTGTGPVIHADLGDNRFVPVNVAGRGLSRLLTLVSVIIDTSGGLVLIDEVEDGLHHSTLVDVWKVVIQSAHKHSVQIVATTHSYECIQAAVEASMGTPGQLAMFRLTRVDDRVRVVDVDDEGLRDAVSLGFEVR